MKKIILPLFVLVLVSFTTDTKLTDEERAFAIEEMSNSRDHLANVVEGLSEAQLNFKSTPEAWSIAECVEHITISENTIFGMMEGTLKTDADPAKRADVKMTDTQLLGIIKDRSNRVKTSEPFEPTGKYGSYEDTLKAFMDKRTSNLSYIKDTNDDLRNRYGQLPFGTVDAYQIVLFMSGHTERHVKQMEEIKANENFPTE